MKGPSGESVELVEALADRVLPYLSELLDPNPAGARSIKENPRRTVRWLDTDVGSFVIKRYRSSGMADVLKDRLGKARALTEWKVSHALRAAGLNAPDPVLIAERSGGAEEAVFVAFAIAHEAPLGGYLEARFHSGDGKSADRAPWLVAAGQLLASIHNRGFDHRDFHGGNVLVCADDPTPASLAVVDLHRVAFGRPALLRRVLALADLSDTLRFAIDPDEREVLVDAYAAATELPGAAADPKRLLAAVDRAVSNREVRRYRSRTKRCVRESSRFTAVQVGGVRGFRKKEVDESALFAAIDRARDAIHLGSDQARSIARRSSVAVDAILEIGVGELGDPTPTKESVGPTGGRAVAVKVYDGDGTRSARGRISRGRAGQAWIAAHGLFVRGIPVPEVVAWLRTPDRAFLVVDEVVDAIPLGALSFRLAGDEPRQVAEAVAALLVSIARARVDVPDLSPKNVLIRPKQGGGFDAYLCDFDGVRLRREMTGERWIRALSQVNDLDPSYPVRDRLRVIHLLRTVVPALRSADVVRRVADATHRRMSKQLRAPHALAASAPFDGPEA